jgi:hypothetical protein
MAHSIGLGTISILYDYVVIGVIDTWTLGIYLFLFTVLESYFFYTAYKVSTIVVPEVVQETSEVFRGRNIRQARFLITLVIGYPLQILIILGIGAYWAYLHFPAGIILHAFIALMISVPISIYALVKSESMFPLLIAWWLWDYVLLFLL